MIDVVQRRALWRLPISPAAKVLAALIADVQCLERGRCDMSLRTLGAETNLSRTNVIRALRELRGWGLTEATVAGCPTWRTVDPDAWTRTAGGSPPGPPAAQVPGASAGGPGPPAARDLDRRRTPPGPRAAHDVNRGRSTRSEEQKREKKRDRARARERIAEDGLRASHDGRQ